MTAAFVSYKRAKDGKTVAHSLDFDLVAVADDEDAAFSRLRVLVKTYNDRLIVVRAEILEKEVEELTEEYESGEGWIE